MEDIAEKDLNFNSRQNQANNKQKFYELYQKKNEKRNSLKASLAEINELKG